MRISDWSSDVCSSDLIDSTEGGRAEQRVAATLETIFPDQHEEDNERHPGDGAGDRGRHHLFEQPGRAEQDGKGSAGSKDTACVALFSDNRPTHFCGSRGRVNQMRRSQGRSEEPTSELQSLMRTLYAAF